MDKLETDKTTVSADQPVPSDLSLEVWQNQVVYMWPGTPRPTPAPPTKQEEIIQTVPQKSDSEIEADAQREAQEKANAEFSNYPYAAELRAQEIKYSQYGIGERLDPYQSDYLLQIRAEIKAKAEFQKYDGADREEIIGFAKGEMLASQGFKEFSLSDQDKIRLGKVRALMLGQAYSEQPLITPTNIAHGSFPRQNPKH